MASSSETKRCLYEILNLSRDCTQDEIKSSYRKLALQRHPDKLIKSGITEAEATASFQELQNAYQILSDARERAWYDSHRSQILFSNTSTNNATSSSGPSSIPDLFSYFSNSVYNGFSDNSAKSFYKVYSDVFDRIYRNELNFASKMGMGNVVKEAPLMGNLGSDYAQVNAFYGYWLGFVTVMDFVWVDEYDAMNGLNRKSRRMMEDENKKIRKKAKREYNETVRGLAEFVKKRDKRVIDMQVKRNEEIERKREEEKVRRKEMERAKAERARAYEVPDWAKVEGDEEVEEEEVEEERRNEFYCVACGKKFKSDKQWKNHEQSKKHKEKVAELRDAFSEEDREDEEDEDDGFVSVDEVEKLKEEFESVEVRKEESESDEEFVDVENVEKEVDDNDNEDDDDEDSVLKAMLKNKKKAGSTKKQKAYAKNVYVEEEAEEVDLMQYNNVKGRRNRRGRNETAKKDETEEQESNDKPEVKEETAKGDELGEKEIIDEPEASSKPEVDKKCDDGSDVEEPSASEPCAEKENNGEGKPEPTVKTKVPKQAPAVKATNKKEVNSKGKNANRGKKQKQEKSRNSGHECDTCGVDFDSRNKLHKHLSDTGHAALKSR